MSAEVKKELHLEIAHVLFMDVVGFSKLLINDQTEILEQLNQLVRETPHFREAEAAGKLIRLSTGDGMALVFSNSAEAPVECALEIGKALKSYPQIQLRMGVHSGPINAVRDVNDRLNVTGAGINMAQRVMDCGEAGHILLSKHVAEDLEQYRQWQPCLHDLGACEVKHGVRIGIVSLYDNGVGNPQLPKKFQALKKRRTHVRWGEAAIALLVLSAVVAAFVLVLRRPVRTTLAAAEKSIAVLPFENLSRDPDNAYFATGIQDEILTRIAKIGALKVIARTSTQQYAARPGNLSEVARQLAVANILEGAVQKAGDQVLINVQLIRAATDEHLWAESYDRKLQNIFGVETEVASAVAEALKAKLTGTEQQALEQKPTSNPDAYEAYLRGLAYSLRPRYDEAACLNATKYFGDAVGLDPKFALAWAGIARENAVVYFSQSGVRSPALREAAKRAADKAIELQPDLGEAYLAQGYVHYYCERDYDSAITWFEKAGHVLPNNSQIPEALGLVCRRKGQWQRSLEYFQHAIELDPRNALLKSLQAETYQMLRRYPAALQAYDQILDLMPDDANALANKAYIYQAQCNLSAAAALLASVSPRASSPLFFAQINQWLYERRYADAIAALKAALQKPDPALTQSDKLGLNDQLAWLYELSGDASMARTIWQQVRSQLEAWHRDDPENVYRMRWLAWVDAGLGEKAKAFELEKRAAKLLPLSKDAMNETDYSPLSEIAVRTGEKDLALEQLAISAQNPVGISYGNLKLDPVWDPLRGDPRFEKIVASLAPKTAGK